jgi:hypothetical protein
VGAGAVVGGARIRRRQPRSAGERKVIGRGVPLSVRCGTAERATTTPDEDCGLMFQKVGGLFGINTTVSVISGRRRE